MDQLPESLQPLAAYRQFILWIAVPKPDGKTDKFPINPTTRKVSDAHDPEIWMGVDGAITLSKIYECQVGFVFTENDPWWFLDIDHCLVEGAWSPLAIELMTLLPGAAAEVSYSGDGLHLIGRGSAPDHAKKNIKAGIEFYTEKRFVALTGTSATGNADIDHTSALGSLVARWFPPKAPLGPPAEWTTGPVPEWGGIEDDDLLIEKMLASRGSAGALLGSKATVSDLWYANVEALSTFFPSETGKNFDESSADAALCSHLAFWTGKDCERMDRLFRRSALYRDKWEKREQYRSNTILMGVGGCTNVHGSKKNESLNGDVPVAAGLSIRQGLQLMSPDQQAQLFAGCVYVRGLHKVLVPNGMLLKPDTFKATYGGYIFLVDDQNEKTTTNAWTAFTESQVNRYPQADEICFRPEMASGVIINFEGRMLVNIYVPIQTDRQEGDATPFIEHLKKVLPDPGDQAILMAYMAAVVQYPGIKFQWCPLIQGTDGNGKTLFTRCVAQAVGLRYSHYPNAKDIGNKFTLWVLGKLFIGIEDVYTKEKQEVIEALKPLITNDRVEIQGKGADQYTGDNRANFLLNSNHRDAIRKTRKDRRFAIFYSAQQDYDDLARDGMQGDYFPRLYDWLKFKGGYGIVTNYLHTYAIPAALNPATLCVRAPDTSSTSEVINEGLGGVEQVIHEAIEMGEPGFCGGWISSVHLQNLLETTRYARNITIHKRSEILTEMGYIHHPHLESGRAQNAIMMDHNKKSRLWIRRESKDCAIKNKAAIAQAYTTAQAGQIPEPHLQVVQ